MYGKDGTAQALQLPKGRYAYPRVSPDGSLLALDTYVVPGSKPGEGRGQLYTSADDWQTLAGPIEITFNLPDVFHTFRKGHRLMVQVQGTWFPVFDRNPQRYVPNIFTARDTDFIAATHRVWLGGANGSRLQATILP